MDTNGRLLAQSVTSFILTARPRDVKDAGALAKVLARELGLDEETILKKLSGSKAASVTLARQLAGGRGQASGDPAKRKFSRRRGFNRNNI